MALIDTPPHIRLLEAMVATADQIDYLDRAGVEIGVVRHARHRYATESEGNSVTFRWLGNEEHEVEGDYKNAQERVRAMNVDIEIDLALKDEESTEDETGWLDLSRVAAATIEGLRDEMTSLVYPGLCNWIIDGEDSPDEDSKPDKGRLVKSVSVVYRVRSDAPNVLLGQGVNG